MKVHWWGLAGNLLLVLLALADNISFSLVLTPPGECRHRALSSIVNFSWSHRKRVSGGCTFKDVRRNLQQDIDELKNYGTWDRFVLCTRGKLLKYRVPNLIDAYQQHGICVHGDAPDIAEFWRSSGAGYPLYGWTSA
ncbi:Cyclin-dependent kinase inhibitor 3 [Anas platyrhynchos]|uniref:protein-tyrosine-phosphatase n=1 Tax=Anas platyrhynchos TaxID=8839 RepID=R0L2G0_ANAPL|nr:Cyclin-dependent kinase inhibitor 3 [Anas platyrhynchos]